MLQQSLISTLLRQKKKMVSQILEPLLLSKVTRRGDVLLMHETEPATHSPQSIFSKQGEKQQQQQPSSCWLEQTVRVHMPVT